VGRGRNGRDSRGGEVGRGRGVTLTDGLFFQTVWRRRLCPEVGYEGGAGCVGGGTACTGGGVYQRMQR